MRAAKPAVRRAGPADAGVIEALTRAVYAKWVPVLGRKPRPMTADYAQAVVKHRIELIETDDRVAALLELLPAPDHLLIVNLAVLPEAQGRGLGSMLLRHAEAVARALGLPEVRLYTNRMMAANVAYYQARGYAVDREEPLPDGGFAVHLSKPVPAAGPLAASGRSR